MASFNNSNRRTNVVKRQEGQDRQDDPPAYDSDDEASPCPSNVRQEITEPNSNGNGNGRRSSDNKNKSRKRKRSQPPSSSDNHTSNLLGVSSASSSAEILVPKRSRLDNNDNNEGDPDLDLAPPDGTPIKARRARRKRRKHHSHPQRNKSRVPVGGAEPEPTPVITVAAAFPVPTTTTDSNSILSLDNRSSVSNAEDFELVQEFNNLYASARLFEQPSNGLRPIAIDGCNVAWGHGNDQEFSYKGIVLCADFFRARGHRVKVFVPRHHQPKIPREIVDELIKAEILVFTPSRNPGKQGKRIVAYDDRFIVQYAVCTGGVVISNDNFNDLFDEQPTWRDTITNRVLQHTWISKDILMFPLDPMGRRGKQSLNDFLRFPEGTITIAPSSLGTLPVPVEVDSDVVPGGVSSKSKTKAESSTCSMNAQCSSPSRTSTHSLKLNNTSGPSSSSLEGKRRRGRAQKENTQEDFDIFNIDLDYVSDRISSRVKADVQKSYMDALASDSDADEV